MANTPEVQAKKGFPQTGSGDAAHAARQTASFRAQKICESDVRLFVENFATAANISPKWSFRLQLIADELFINAIDYGTESENDQIEIVLEKNNEQLSVAVSDPGKKGQMLPDQLRKKINDVQSSANPLAQGGKGISLIVHQWANQLDIESMQPRGLRITARIILLKE